MLHPNLADLLIGGLSPHLLRIVLNFIRKPDQSTPAPYVSEEDGGIF